MNKKNRGAGPTPQVKTKRQKHGEFERYASLINIFNGYEEYFLDAQGIIISSNLEAVNITCYEEREVIGKPISIFYPVEDRLVGKHLEDLAKCEKDGSLVFTSLWMKKRSSSFLARVKMEAIKNSDELPVFRVILQDTTYKAVSNQRIRQIRNEYLSLFNNSFVGIIKFDMLDFSIIKINEKAERIISGVAGRREMKFRDIFDSTRHFDTLINDLRKAKKVDQFEFKLRNKDQWLLTSLRYFVHEGIAEGILTNITEVKRKDTEIVRLNHELDELIYHASHELRSPLATMLGLINLMKLEDKDGFTASIRNHLDLIESKIKKLDQVLKKIVASADNTTRQVSNNTIGNAELQQGTSG